MDRRNFINKEIVNNTVMGNICQSDDCECEITLEKHELKKTSSFHFSIIIMMAFICTTVMSIVKIEAAKINVAEVTPFKKGKVISCAPGYTNKKKLGDDHEPANRDNQNSCSHQQGFLCETNSSKRKSLKTHYC